MFKLPQRTTIQVAGIFCLLLASYHLIFRDFFPLPNGLMGHDYVLTLGGFLDGYLWYQNNGFITPPWFTPSFCGGQALFADPQSAFYSIPQFLTFLVDPLQAVYWAFLIFATLGFWGMYIFSRKCLSLGRMASLVAACVFMFNGFYSHRIIIGHYGYQAFMLTPLIAWLLCKSTENDCSRWQKLSPAIPAGLLIAYWFHSGLTTLIIPSALAAIGLACLVFIKQLDKQFIVNFISRGTLAGILAIGLCASKLNANLALMGNFSRDYYLLPGLSYWHEVFIFVFKSLFYSSEHVFHWVTPLWKNMQWSAMPHELAYGNTPVTAIVIFIGLALFLLRHHKGKKFKASSNHLSIFFAYLTLSTILIIPIALLYYTPEWNETLKNLPLIGSTTSPFRWIIIYIPIVSVVTGIASAVNDKMKPFLTALCIICVPLLNALENRDFYKSQHFNPSPYINFYEQVKSKEITPHIHSISDPRNEADLPVIDNSQFIQGHSPIRCYNPLYGYRLEKLVTSNLTEGSVNLSLSQGTLNMHNPACLVFPNENNCTPWSNFKENEKYQLTKFVQYHVYDFQKNTLQKILDLVNTISIIGAALLIIKLAIRQPNVKRQKI